MEKSKSTKKVIVKNKGVVKKSNNASKKKKVLNNLLEDKKYKLAEKYYKNKDFENAYKEYLNLCDIYPKNKKIYKRLIESLTRGYTYKENTRDFKIALDDYITTYKLLCTKKEGKYFENKLFEYKSVKVSGSKSRFLLISLLGFLGVHKFIEKKYLVGIIYLLTLGFFGIGVIVDLINDYAEYEDIKQLNIVRYIISFFVFVFSLLRLDTTNYYYFIIIAILITPIIYSKVLRLIPSIVKVVTILVLCYFGLKVSPVIEYVPAKIIGTWITDNENTNFKEINIKLDNSTIKFNDRDEETGNNQYVNETKVLKIYVNDTNYYKFKIDLENEIICTYNDSNRCVISFKKNK